MNGQEHDEWDEQDNYFEDFAEYAKALRTWFVAYGVGGPVLLLTNEGIRERIAASGLSGTIAFCFLLGVALQVLGAVVNKASLWGCFKAARQPALRMRPRFRVAKWFADVLIVDLAIDVASMLAFGWATYRVFQVLTV